VKADAWEAAALDWDLVARSRAAGHRDRDEAEREHGELGAPAATIAARVGACPVASSTHANRASPPSIARYSRRL
jgi:hypothetical protein